MKTITITQELAQNIADYLATKPFREVAPLLAEFAKQAETQPAPAAEPVVKPEADKGSATSEPVEPIK